MKVVSASGREIGAENKELATRVKEQLANPQHQSIRSLFQSVVTAFDEEKLVNNQQRQNLVEDKQRQFEALIPTYAKLAKALEANHFRGLMTDLRYLVETPVENSMSSLNNVSDDDLTKSLQKFEQTIGEAERAFGDISDAHKKMIAIQKDIDEHQGILTKLSTSSKLNLKSDIRNLQAQFRKASTDLKMLTTWPALSKRLEQLSEALEMAKNDTLELQEAEKGCVWLEEVLPKIKNESDLYEKGVALQRQLNNVDFERFKEVFTTNIELIWQISNVMPEAEDRGFNDNKSS